MICFVKTKAEQAAPFFRRGLNRKTGISFFTSFRKRGVKLKKSSRTFLPFFLPSGAVKRGLKLLSHLKARDMKKQILFLFNLLKLNFPQPAVFLMRSRLCGLPRGRLLLSFAAGGFNQRLERRLAVCPLRMHGRRPFADKSIRGDRS